MDEAIIKRILPHSIDAEKAVIGSMIMDADAVVAASEMITGDDFYQRQYGILFDAMVELYNEGKPVDVLTLQERLKMKDVPEEFPMLVTPPSITAVSIRSLYLYHGVPHA